MKTTWIASEITYIEWFMIKHFWSHSLVILAIVVIIQLELDLDVIFEMFQINVSMQLITFSFISAVCNLRLVCAHPGVCSLVLIISSTLPNPKSWH